MKSRRTQGWGARGGHNVKEGYVASMVIEWIGYISIQGCDQS